jgi:hypothetical protein
MKAAAASCTRSRVMNEPDALKGFLARLDVLVLNKAWVLMSSSWGEKGKRKLGKEGWAGRRIVGNLVIPLTSVLAVLVLLPVGYVTSQVKKKKKNVAHRQ